MNAYKFNLVRFAIGSVLVTDVAISAVRRRLAVMAEAYG